MKMRQWKWKVTSLKTMTQHPKYNNHYQWIVQCIWHRNFRSTGMRVLVSYFCLSSAFSWEIRPSVKIKLFWPWYLSWRKWLWSRRCHGEAKWKSSHYSERTNARAAGIYSECQAWVQKPFSIQKLQDLQRNVYFPKRHLVVGGWHRSMSKWSTWVFLTQGMIRHLCTPPNVSLDTSLWVHQTQALEGQN